MSKPIKVPFHGATLYVVDHNGEPYTPLKPIVEGVGLAWQTQHRKIEANAARWGITMKVIPSRGGKQEAACIPLRKLAGWLMTLHPSRVKPELRDKITAYQNECDDALWKYWSEGAAERAPKALPPAQKALPPPDPVTNNLRGRINRKTHEIALKQYDTIHAILTATVEDNLACGATEEGCEGYIEKYGDLADGTVLMNIRDAQELVFSCGRVIDEAATAIAAIKRIEKRSGFNLYPRPGPSKYSNPDFHKHDRMIEEVIDRMVGNDTRQIVGAP